MDSKKDFRIVIILLILFSTFIFSRSGDLDSAKEGALMLQKSMSVPFPVNILYFYIGSLQLNNAVSASPYNVRIRYVRMEAFFEFVDNNKMAQDVVLEDGEFIVIIGDKKTLEAQEILKVYYMLTYTLLLKKDIVKGIYYYKKLKELQNSNNYVDKLKERFPNFKTANTAY
ncbi:hypothetical protein [Fervidobacterium gondwanense]|uniref:Uncharacterized protein n=1 Tax=Fervidobacterium gondwanense DSM 13020 TaxID=1121883 RepID=A0A1M7SCJ5_FERGO|nr:hypothetical protein [Fervidobacterium gondwanense]SHN56204.1 hypothetical protein SAMN02745226_00743 [Fervidobacterium gondwanense DSM 13020]